MWPLLKNQRLSASFRGPPFGRYSIIIQDKYIVKAADRPIFSSHCCPSKTATRNVRRTLTFNYFSLASLSLLPQTNHSRVKQVHTRSLEAIGVKQARQVEGHWLHLKTWLQHITKSVPPTRHWTSQIYQYNSSRGQIFPLKPVKFCKSLLCTHWNLAVGHYSQCATNPDSGLNNSFSVVSGSRWICCLGLLEGVIKASFTMGMENT